MFRRLIALAATTALTAGLLVAFQAPAGAHRTGQPYEQGTNDVPYSFDDTECGFTFHIDGHFRDRYKIYRAPGSDQAFLFENWYSWKETLTNPATGKRMYISGSGHYREVKATLIEGNVYEFIALDTGPSFTVRNSRGRIVLADFGTLVTGG